MEHERSVVSGIFNFQGPFISLSVRYVISSRAASLSADLEKIIGGNYLSTNFISHLIPIYIIPSPSFATSGRNSA